jgi:demethylmenaquinone methyltransferase/2-methoxy-6-polyprenyl-1,4-benzoquinol methylase
MTAFTKKLVIGIFLFPIIASLVLNYVLPTPQLDHGSGSMFDLIATRYDFINRALALNLDIGWRKVMVREVAKNVQKSIESNGNNNDVVHFLDLATGTADVAILLAKEYDDHFSKISSSKKRNFHILGVDPSINMITVGREKIKSQKLSNRINLEIGDARELNDLPDDKFHAATMSFGIRNVPEKEKAFCEIHRVLKKDQHTKLAILEFSEPSADAGIMGALARIFIRHIVPSVGALLSGAPREYMHLQNSIKEFPSPKNFVKLMEGVRCNNGGRRGTFVVDKLKHLNFGSVQLYIATPVFM